jgi:hypothetical protein
MGDDELKKRILARRARLVAAAITASGLAAGVGTLDACGGTTTSDAGVVDGASDGPQVCLAPQPCLDPLPPDAGRDADAAPQPCLAPLPPDAGDASDG